MSITYKKSLLIQQIFKPNLILLALVSLASYSTPAWSGFFWGKSTTTSTPNSTVTQKATYATSTGVSTRAVTGNYGRSVKDEGWDYLADLLEATDMDPVENLPGDVQRYGDMWQRVRKGFKMDLNQENARIASQRNWFITRQPYLDRLAARASRYLYHTVTEAEKRGIPTELALLPVIESSYDPGATSSAAAAGLWQFIPSTGKIYGLRQNQWYDSRRDVTESTRAAYDFLNDLYKQFGSWELALAAYNAGPGRIQQAIRRNVMDGLPTDYWSLRLPEETMNYVPRFLAVAQIVRQPQEYGVSLMPIANRLHFRQVSVPGQLSLETIAQTAGMTTQEFYQLNPGYRQGYTDPASNNKVLIPDSTPRSVDKRLATLRPSTSLENIMAQNNTAPVITSGSSNFTLNNGLPKNSDDLAKFASRQPVNAVSGTAGAVISTAGAVVSTGAAAVATGVRTAAAHYDTPKGIFTAAAQKISGTTSLWSGKNNSSVTSSGQSLDPMARQYGQAKEVMIPVEHVSLSSNSGSNTAANASISTTNSSLPASNSQSSSNITNGVTSEPPVGALPTDASATVEEEPKKLVFVEPVYAAKSPIGTKAKTASNVSNDRIENALSSMRAPNKLNGLKRVTYKVQAGDTLRSVAEEYGVTMKQLEEWNQISRSAKLLRGSMLYIYTDKSTSTATKSKPVSYVVQSGDSLIEVANRFGLSVQELAGYNDMSPKDDLRVGEKLSLVESSANKHDSKQTTYTVKRGDTLGSIADKFGLSVQDLADLNHKKVTYEVKSGEMLQVTEKSDSKTSAKDKTEKLDRKEKATTEETYIVKKGDTWEKVIAKTGMSKQELVKANDLSKATTLRPGQKLKIDATEEDSTTSKASSHASRPARYTVKAGDTLTSVAEKFDLSKADLAEMNDLKPTSDLIKGKILVLTASTTKEKVSDEPKEKASKKESDNDSMELTKYTVKQGDTWTSVAKRAGLTTKELGLLNRKSPTGTLAKGTSLMLPAGTSVAADTKDGNDKVVTKKLPDKDKTNKDKEGSKEKANSKEKDSVKDRSDDKKLDTSASKKTHSDSKEKSDKKKAKN